MLQLCGIVLLVFFGAATTSYGDSITVPTIAALRNVDVSALTNDTTALVIDYYLPGEVVHHGGWETHGRGGGFFRWRAGNLTPDDGGRFIAPNAYSSDGRWERMLNGAVANVKMWGAKGDGETNAIDTIAFQKAVDACVFPWTSELLVPAGTYILTNTIVFRNTLHLRGEGMLNNTMIFMPSSFGKDIFRTSNANSALKGGIHGTNDVFYNVDDELIDYDHGLIVEELQIAFLESTETMSTNAILVLSRPGEAMTLRNLMLGGGGYGIRCLGVGTPGLRVNNVSVGYQTVAGISIESLVLDDGSLAGGFGCASLATVSGDCFSQNKSQTSSLIRLYRCTPNVTITDFKAEGEFGAGVIRYELPPDVNSHDAMGILKIKGGTYNGTASYGSPHDLVVLSGDTNTLRTASVSIEGINVSGCKNLIRDEITGRNVEADVDLYSGSAQTACRLPIHYEGTVAQGYDGDTNAFLGTSRLVMGQTAYSYLYATNTGWYRVMMPLTIGHTHIAGKLVISSYGKESTELQIDVTPGFSAGPSITVSRASLGSTTPIVTQARAFWWWSSPINTYWAGVDIKVGNPWVSAYREKEKRITFALDLNGDEVFDSAQIQLLGIPIPVSDTLPTNYVSTVVNTYR
jgi:hypothetical protein